MDTKTKEKIKRLSIAGAVFTIIFGSFLHFFYEWSGNNFIIGLFAPVNESVWEHMKLVFTPFVLFAFFEYFSLKDKVDNFCFALMKEIGVAITFILAVFYIYTQFSNESILAVDIASFVVGVFLAKWLGYEILTKKFKHFEFEGLNNFSAVILLALAAFFFYATIDPPRTKLFQDPVTNSYGIHKITY